MRSVGHISHASPYIGAYYAELLAAPAQLRAAEHTHAVHAVGAVGHAGGKVERTLATKTGRRPAVGARGSGGGPAGGGVLLVW